MASLVIRIAAAATAVVLALVGVQLFDDDLGDSTQLVAGDGTVAPRAASPTTTATPTTAAPTTTAAPRRAVLGFTGDLLPHSPVVRAAAANADGSGYDFGPMFDLVRPRLATYDLAICHLETPLSRDGSAISGYPVFNAPPSLADAIAGAGYDGCSTASNHSFDRRGDGVRSTLDVLDAAGVRHAGMARSPEEAEAATYYLVNGISIAHLSFTYGLNGFTLPADEPYLVDVIDAERILDRAAAARAANADFVVLSLHWGVEYQRSPSADQLALAERLLPSPDIDLIIGHHAHVVQPVGRVGDEVVVYGLGNFLSNQSAACCVAASQDGVIVEVTLAERGDGRIAVESIDTVPTWVDRSDYTIVPVQDALSDPELAAARRSELEASLGRTVEAIGLLGE